MVELIAAMDEHIEPLWNIIREMPDYWSEEGAVSTLDEFALWFRSVPRAPLVGMWNGEVIACGYVDPLYPGHYASAHIFKRAHTASMREMKEAIRGALVFWMERYDLAKVIGIVRSTNRPMRAVLRMFGFKVDGVLRHHKQVNGVWTDYILCSVLRGEL